MNKFLIINVLVFLLPFALSGQETDGADEKTVLDSLYIAETEKVSGKPKVLHAEPLYIDLIRDLGARKGEKEWNVGVGLTDNLTFDSYEALVEYEWAPADRLGLEVELPFTFYSNRSNGDVEVPGSRLNSIKGAMQYTFLVSEKRSASMAFGYIHEFELQSFRAYNTNVFKGNVFNPFLIAAKRWGNNFHTLIYTGPVIEQIYSTGQWSWNMQINSNFHYMIPGTRNFIGVELNKEIYKDDFDMVIRPQMRLEITEHLLIGIVAGIPVQREDQRFSAFTRIIYEPPHRNKKKGSAAAHLTSYRH
jgi:hypothetical protein